MGKRGPPPGEGGRPQKDVDLALIRRAASPGCTHEEIAVLAGIGLATIQRRLVDNPKVQRVIAEGREQGRSTLRRLQWQQANTGNVTMLIWLGKQLLNQRDRFDATATVTHTIGGVDRPPLIDESDADWLQRRRTELAALELERKQLTEPAATLIDAATPSEQRH